VIERNEDNALVKSPVEVVVGLMRQSGGELVAPVAAAVALAGMGQNLFSPPNVRGWPGGEAWINTATLLARKQFIERALSPAMMDAGVAPTMAPNMPATPENGVEGLQRRLRMLEQTRSVRVEPDTWLKSAGLAPERPLNADARARLEAAVLSVPPTVHASEGALALDALRAAVLDPAYQLK
jgi:hypothetical protein